MRDRTARSFAALALGLLIEAGPVQAGPLSDYRLHCQGCHGPEGEGVAEGALPFRGQVARFLSLPRGREYLVRVPGFSLSELPHDRAAAVLNWLLVRFDAESLPVDWPRFTASEVERWRSPPWSDVRRVRALVLEGASRADGAEPSF